jgi:hypothetical protein
VSGVAWQAKNWRENRRFELSRNATQLNQGLGEELMKVYEIRPASNSTTGLRAGDLVEVRSATEILATLDEQGRLDALQFMPEMLKFCGRQLTVRARADKTCDTIEKTGGRRIYNTVHLGDEADGDGVRCDGSAHGGCQATCLVFWKEAWLKPVTRSERAKRETLSDSNSDASLDAVGSSLRRFTVANTGATARDTVFRCQVTQLREFTTPLAWWDLRQYYRDVASGNVKVRQIAKAAVFVSYRTLVNTGVGYRALLWLYNSYKKLVGGPPWPYVQGTLSKTPKGELHLQVGELVRVKSLSDILATLNPQNRNHGLYFDGELVKFCGGTYQVLKRVSRIIDEKSGQMLEFSNPCIILQNVYCKADISPLRLFCPRSIYPYWREIWLERLAAPAEAAGQPRLAAKNDVLERVGNA